MTVANGGTNGQKTSEEQMLTSGKNCAKNYQLRSTEIVRSWKKIFIGFKKNKNLNYSAKTCMSKKLLCMLREFYSWSSPLNSKKAIQ